MSLDDGEYTCLLLMAEGNNLLRMENTKWHGPITRLYEKDFCKCIGNENYVITQRGVAALAGHEETLDGDLRQTITKHGQINDNRKAVHAKMLEAKAALIAGAKMAAMTTGQPEAACFEQMWTEIGMRAREELK